MKYTVIAGWISAILALITMLIGHMGKHDLNWMSNNISTFAANAPNDAWITSSMFISAFSLLCIGILISKYKILGSNYFIHLLPLLIGAAISGLIVLAIFEESTQFQTTRAIFIRLINSRTFSLLCTIPLRTSIDELNDRLRFYCAHLDPLTPRHVEYLYKAKELGDKLIVILNT